MGWLLVAAAVWSAGLVAASFLVEPSLEQVNGPEVLLPVGAPLVVVALVASLLMVRRQTGGRWLRTAALVLAGALDAFTVVALLTIGIFVVPVAVLVTVACATSGPGPMNVPTVSPAGPVCGTAGPRSTGG